MLKKAARSNLPTFATTRYHPLMWGGLPLLEKTLWKRIKAARVLHGDVVLIGWPRRYHDRRGLGWRGRRPVRAAIGFVDGARVAQLSGGHRSAEDEIQLVE